MTGPAGPWARFDDLVAGSAQLYPRIESELVAHHSAEVADVLDEVERLTAQGRWAFGFVSYEAAAGLDPDLAVGDPVDGLPLVWFGITAEPIDVPVIGPIAAGDRRDHAVGPWSREWDAERHRRAVDAVRARIAAGETYQCNLTTRLIGPARGEETQLYQDLALGQRGAHNAYLDTGRFVVASASPELFFELRGDRILMRPMKGTAPRGRTVAEDDRVVARLLGSAKERAENVMIVDLVRNDLARVAVTGSVAVPRLLRPERYPTVHQLTSDVTADLRPGIGVADVFRALFPCGSVTGAPKTRTMELIRDLEDSPRGVYCGAVGVVAPPGSPVRARFSVAIRTVVVDRVHGTATYGTGGGITWDSDPAAEYAELLAKARVLDAHPEEFHLVETMRHEAGRGVCSLDAHLARAAGSAHFFGFRFDQSAVRAALRAHLTGVGDARVRLRCYRDGNIGVDLGDLPAPDRGQAVLVIDDVPVDTTECWPHHKTSRRQPYTTRLRRHPDAADVVLVNERGEVTETCTAALAVSLDGTWWTPPLASGCLPGVERARLVAAGVVRERVLRPADLRGAAGLALLSSLRGWRPAVLAPEPGRSTEIAPARRSRGITTALSGRTG